MAAFLDEDKESAEKLLEAPAVFLFLEEEDDDLPETFVAAPAADVAGIASAEVFLLFVLVVFIFLGIFLAGFFDEDEEPAETLLEAPAVFIFLDIFLVSFFEEDEEPPEAEAPAADVAVVESSAAAVAAEVFLFSMISEVI